MLTREKRETRPDPKPLPATLDGKLAEYKRCIKRRDRWNKRARKSRTRRYSEKTTNMLGRLARRIHALRRELRAEGIL